MKKSMFLSAIVGLAFLAMGAAASAQAQVPNAVKKDLVNRVRCPGNDQACIKLDLYQKMAGTSSNARAATHGAAKAASSAQRSVLKSRPSGGTENNPAMDGASSSHHRAVRTERPTHQAAQRTDNRAPHVLRAREVTRHRPTDY